MAEPIISFQNVCMYFGGVKAIDNISFDVEQRSSFRGLPSLLATIAISIAASLSATSNSFTSPAVPGAAAARTGLGETAGAATVAAALFFLATITLPMMTTTIISAIRPTNTTT